MSPSFHVPESLLAWVNIRLQKTEQAFQLQAVELGDDGAIRIEATVQKYMISAPVEVKARLEAKGDKLVVRGLQVETKNPMIRGMLKQFLPLLIAKARASLGKHDVEILDPGAKPGADPANDSQASA